MVLAPKIGYICPLTMNTPNVPFAAQVRVLNVDRDGIVRPRRGLLPAGRQTRRWVRRPPNNEDPETLLGLFKLPQ